MRRFPPDPIRSLTALDRRLDEARDILQRTDDRDPAFEKRVRDLIRLTDKRERTFLATFHK